MSRNRRSLLGAAVAGALIVLGIVILVGGRSGSSSSATTTAPAATTGSAASDGDSIFAGVPQHGDTLGNPAAPALLVFEDPQCPFCREFNLNVLPTVVDQFVRTGRVKLVYRGIEIISANSVPGIQAIYAAGAQNKLWQVNEAMYRRQGEERSGWITPSVIAEVTHEAGASPAQVKKKMTSASVTAAMNEATAEANQLQLQGTPSFYIQRPPGLPQQVQVTSLDPSAFSSALDSALQ